MKPIESLLYKLCVDLGFCLPPKEHDAIVANPPDGVEGFARRVWEAEGMDPPRSQDPLFQRLCEAIGQFPKLGHLRVVWPDGALIADVEVAPDCTAVETTHVMGYFTPGPAFDQLAPFLDEFQRKWAADEKAAAFRVSQEIDSFGLVASDDIGRLFRVFNAHFVEPGLLFAIASMWSPT
ncbi:MAG: hypothetical protein AAF938_27405 [Myxococcota bacterium]